MVKQELPGLPQHGETLDGQLLKIFSGAGIFCGILHSFSLSYHFPSEVLLAWFPSRAHADLVLL